VLMTKETLWKNNVNFIKDVLVIFVHLIIIVMIVCEKKIEDVTFLPTFAYCNKT
jgi:hypothetical protein